MQKMSEYRYPEKYHTYAEAMEECRRLGREFHRDFGGALQQEDLLEVQSIRHVTDGGITIKSWRARSDNLSADWVIEVTQWWLTSRDLQGIGLAQAMKPTKLGEKVSHVRR